MRNLLLALLMLAACRSAPERIADDLRAASVAAEDSSEARMRVALGELLEAEAMFHGTHGRYSAREDSLGFRTLEYPGVLVAVQRAGVDGFQAEAIAEGTERRCTVHAGDAYAWERDDRPREIRCRATARAPRDTPEDARR